MDYCRRNWTYYDEQFVEMSARPQQKYRCVGTIICISTVTFTILPNFVWRHGEMTLKYCVMPNDGRVCARSDASKWIQHSIGGELTLAAKQSVIIDRQAKRHESVVLYSGNSLPPNIIVFLLISYVTVAVRPIQTYRISDVN